MIRRNFDILAALLLVLFLAGAGEFRERVQRARLQGPDLDLVVHSDWDRMDIFSRIEERLCDRMERIHRFSRIEEKLSEGMDRIDRRINDRVLRISQRIENFPNCPFEK
jgi:hypothetical protein